MTETPIRPLAILLVESDVRVSSPLIFALQQAGYAVDWAQNVRSANAAMKATRYELLLLDVQLSDGSGLSLLAKLRARRSDLLVLVTSACGRVDIRVAGLDLGADDFLPKPFDIKELMARIRALMRRRYGVPEIVLRAGDLTVHPAARTARLNNAPIELTKREFSLLVLLLEHQGRVVTRRQIESSLYESGSETESNSVEVYVHHLRKRLGAELIRTVRGEGYLIDSERREPPACGSVDSWDAPIANGSAPGGGRWRGGTPKTNIHDAGRARAPTTQLSID